MNSVFFHIEITDFGYSSLKRSIKRDSRSKIMIEKSIEKLSSDPLSGKRLKSELSGFRSLKTDDRKFRIIYSYDLISDEIIIHAVGNRNKIYDDFIRVFNSARFFQN